MRPNVQKVFLKAVYFFQLTVGDEVSVALFISYGRKPVNLRTLNDLNDLFQLHTETNLVTEIY